MPWKEFIGWIAFEKIEPCQTIRSDWHNAHIISTLANVNRAKGRKTNIKDCLLDFEPKRAQDPAEMESKFKSFFGKLIKKKT